MKTVKVMLVFLVCITFGSNAVAQPPIPDNCWSSDPCSAPWECTDHWFNYQDRGAGLVGNVKYCYRDCNGEIEIIIDWSNTYLLDPSFFASGSYEEIDFDGAMEYLKSHALGEVIDAYSGLIPVCNPTKTNGKKFFNIYTARCGVWVKCSYKVDTNAEIKKDIGYEGDCPLPYNHNGDSYIDVWKWQSCGEICCKKSYEICKEFIPTYGTSIYRINNVNASPAPGEHCSDEGTFRDWKTGLPYPCKDGCSGSGNK